MVGAVGLGIEEGFSSHPPEETIVPRSHSCYSIFLCSVWSLTSYSIPRPSSSSTSASEYSDLEMEEKCGLSLSLFWCVLVLSTWVCALASEVGGRVGGRGGRVPETVGTVHRRSQRRCPPTHRITLHIAIIETIIAITIRATTSAASASAFVSRLFPAAVAKPVQVSLCDRRAHIRGVGVSGRHCCCTRHAAGVRGGSAVI